MEVLAPDSGTGDSYEEDKFMDGEETSSKEVRRHKFDLDSGTSTPAQQNDAAIGNGSVDMSSTPDGGSGGHAIRPSAIDTILKEKK